MLDLQNTSRAVAQKLCKDEDVSEAVRRRRVRALLLLGKVWLRVGSGQGDVVDPPRGEAYSPGRSSAEDGVVAPDDEDPLSGEAGAGGPAGRGAFNRSSSGGVDLGGFNHPPPSGGETAGEQQKSPTSSSRFEGRFAYRPPDKDPNRYDPRDTTIDVEDVHVNSGGAASSSSTTQQAPGPPTANGRSGPASGSPTAATAGTKLRILEYSMSSSSMGRQLAMTRCRDSYVFPTIRAKNLSQKRHKR